MDRNSPAETLAERIRSRTCTYGVLGLGYVGLPLAVAFAKEGVKVIGFDVDASKVEQLRAQRSYIPDVTSQDVASVVGRGLLEATTDFQRLAEADVVSICVPTPLSKSRDPDMSYVDASVKAVRETLRRGQLIILESTTYPGTTEEFCRPRLENGGLLAGRDFFLAFSPERVDPGNAKYGIRNTPKVVGGTDATSGALAESFYRIGIDDVRRVSSASAAEMAKLLENTFRSVNIGLVNEVAIMCDRLGLDVWEVISAAASKPFGFMRFDPGPGIGGHCIPLDPLYLSWKLRTLAYRARFVELSDDVNSGMPHYVVERVVAALNDHQKSLRGSRVLVLGVAYKRDVDDVRESPALEVLRLLRHKGAAIHFADPYIESVTIDDLVLRRTPVTPETLASFDAAVVTTDHAAFPWKEIAQHASLIVDARNAVPRQHVRGVLVPLSGPSHRGTPAAARPQPAGRPA